MGSGIVYSPALYPSATKVWISAGFTPFRLLDVMEMALGTGIVPPDYEIEATNTPSWGPLVAIDHLAFDGFWRMSEEGLIEAMKATPRATVLTARIENELAGYALVGSQMTVSYLQRVAVAPSFAGPGHRGLVGAGLRPVGLQTRVSFARSQSPPRERSGPPSLRAGGVSGPRDTAPSVEIWSLRAGRC